MTEGFDYDVIVIGSGFGGSVAALRATEKGYRVGVLESRRRWPDDAIPKSNWDITRYLWQRLAPTMPRAQAVPTHAPTTLRFEKPRREAFRSIRSDICWTTQETTMQSSTILFRTLGKSDYWSSSSWPLPSRSTTAFLRRPICLDGRGLRFPSDWSVDPGRDTGERTR
jgi:choline dehydrogenase-like flavoprotein